MSDQIRLSRSTVGRIALFAIIGAVALTSAADGSSASGVAAGITIEASPVMVTAGAAVSDSVIGRVSSDGEVADKLGVATVTIDGGSAATKDDITLTDIRLGESGVVTAYIAAGTSATNTSFTLAVTDSLGRISNTTLSVLVAPNTCPGAGSSPRRSTPPPWTTR